MILKFLDLNFKSILRRGVDFGGSLGCFWTLGGVKDDFIVGDIFEYNPP